MSEAANAGADDGDVVGSRESAQPDFSQRAMSDPTLRCSMQTFQIAPN